MVHLVIQLPPLITRKSERRSVTGRVPLINGWVKHQESVDGPAHDGYGRVRGHS
jgi:hypothetical protein